MLLGLCFSGLLSSVTLVCAITFYVYVFMCENKNDDDGWLTHFPVPLLAVCRGTRRCHEHDAALNDVTVNWAWCIQILSI